jgi:hypothetical protein
MIDVRTPAVAGVFYPGDAAELGRAVKAYLSKAAADSEAAPKALIAPHAGYIYSGPIAASAYAQLAPLKGRIRRVVLIGPSHRVGFNGLALSTAGAYAMPGRLISIDRELAAKLGALPGVRLLDQAHLSEHSLEVHLPFLVEALGDFALVPIVAGAASPGLVADLLEAAWGGDETLIVVSSDLSHYLPYATAQRVDNTTAQSILRLQQPIEHDQACGSTPVSGLILAARRHHLTPHLLDLRNSGDTAGSHDRVVGYAAFAFTPAAKFPEETGHDD